MTEEQAANLRKLVDDGVLTAEEVAAIQANDAKNREQKTESE
jgi:hypothetical protein